jgi:small subunit ribosomal protein S17
MATKKTPTGAASTAAARGSRKVRIGTVVSNRMSKTVVVRVDRFERHSLYPRRIQRSSTFAAHSEDNAAKIGDLVKIMETRPISKTKRWRVVEILRRGGGTAPADAGLEPAGQENA